MKGLRIGEILVQQGILTQDQVQHVLKIQQAVGRPFGDLVERLYDVAPDVVQSAWVEQYAQMAGQMDLADVHADADCVKLISRRQAWQFHVVPLFREDGHLHVVTSEDSLVRAVNFVSRTLNEPVYFRLADKQAVHDCLMRNYPVSRFLAQHAEAF